MNNSNDATNKMLMKRGITIINPQNIETHGKTPREASHNSGKHGLVLMPDGNLTTTSACNQSFQFGYSHQIG